jgi:hypothetical protein
LKKYLRAKKLSHAHVIGFHKQIPERLGLGPRLILGLCPPFFYDALELLPDFVDEDAQRIGNKLSWIGSK